MPSPDRLRPGGDLTADAVAAVVTSFRPGPALPALVAAIRPQVAEVVVVDDATPTAYQGDALAQCEALGAVVVRHERNSGIGQALATGAARARATLPGAAWLLTLDQDSLPPAGFVAALLDTAARAAGAGLDVAMVGPSAAGRVRSAAVRGPGPVALSREPVQSGLLVPLDVLDRLGGFATELFIDGVDTDLYLRARRAGLVAVAAEVRLEHALGSTHVVRIAGRSFGLVHAAPFRYYYIARNRVHLLRRHGRAAPGWAVSAVLRDVRHLAVTTVLVPGRAARLRETAAGLRDGWRGVVGRRPDPGRPGSGMIALP